MVIRKKGSWREGGMKGRLEGKEMGGRVDGAKKVGRREERKGKTRHSKLLR